MPFYIHWSDVAIELVNAEADERETLMRDYELSRMDNDPLPPFAPFAPMGDRGCGCRDCRLTTWERYWDAHPELPRVLPEMVSLPPLILPPFVHIVAIATDARTAHEERKRLQGDAPLTVTFLPTNEERTNWRWRERRKVERTASTGCQHLPWFREPFQYALNDLHHAYLSVEKPGLIAYTPSEEWGVADRQLRVRPGRYLEQFAPHLTMTERDAFCAQVKAIDDKNVVKFATSPDEIVRVYRDGPDSCMSHDVSDYSTHGIHPVSVYGNSDLQLAYMDDGGRNIRARVLVWPDRKIFSRVYGDNTLKYLLTAQGYENGSLAGARVRAVRLTPNVYVMPYIDGIEYADHIGQYMRLLPEDETGDYQTQNTNGTTDHNYSSEDDDNDIETWMCRADDCDTEVDSDGDLCRSCQRMHHTCERCDDEFFTDMPDSIDGYGDMCSSCYSRHSRDCATCGERFAEIAYDETERRERRENELGDYCLDCGAEELQTRKDAAEAERRAWIATINALQVSLMTRRFSATVSVSYEVSR